MSEYHEPDTSSHDVKLKPLASRNSAGSTMTKPLSMGEISEEETSTRTMVPDIGAAARAKKVHHAQRAMAIGLLPGPRRWTSEPSLGERVTRGITYLTGG